MRDRLIRGPASQHTCCMIVYEALTSTPPLARNDHRLPSDSKNSRRHGSLFSDPIDKLAGPHRVDCCPTNAAPAADVAPATGIRVLRFRSASASIVIAVQSGILISTRSRNNDFSPRRGTRKSAHWLRSHSRSKFRINRLLHFVHRHDVKSDSSLPVFHVAPAALPCGPCYSIACSFSGRLIVNGLKSLFSCDPNERHVRRPDPPSSDKRLSVPRDHHRSSFVLESEAFVLTTCRRIKRVQQSRHVQNVRPCPQSPLSTIDGCLDIDVPDVCGHNLSVRRPEFLRLLQLSHRSVPRLVPGQMLGRSAVGDDVRGAEPERGKSDVLVSRTTCAFTIALLVPPLSATSLVTACR